MPQSHAHISVIIVNYKVKEYIANLLSSLNRAKQHFTLQIFVVDNNSGDDSIAYLRERFSEVHYIQNSENVGFGRANNQAIELAEGEFTLIINPDTLVSEDTLTTLVQHMHDNPKCGAAGCKILNPDGTFAPESRRSVPTIGSAASKVFGLNSLFPNSRIFGKYYMSWLSEDEASQVPVLSGSFMFWRTHVLQQLDGFDERFFMYGEDIDLCYRIQETGFHIDYVPQTSIIHYKGESTKKGDLRYIRIFNKALYQFFEKHYSSRYSLFFRFFIFVSIGIRTALSFLAQNFKRVRFVIADLLLLNLSIILGFVIRYGLQGEMVMIPEGLKFLWINGLASVLYLLSGSILGMFRQKADSISTTLKALALTYTEVVFITFFVRDLAYSRLGLIIGFAFGVLFFVSYKLFHINKTGTEQRTRGRLKNSGVLVVGSAEISDKIAGKIHSRPDWSYEVIGIVSVENEPADAHKYLGSLSQLRDLIHAYQAEYVFFALQSISYKQMLKEISSLQKEQVIFKLIPDSMDFILGKSNVEYLESMPLVEVDFAYSRPVNKLLKRVMDLSIALPAFLILLGVIWPSLLFRRADMLTVGELKFHQNINRHKWKNRLRLFGYVISGRLSFIGSPISSEYGENSSPIKKGISGLVQINEKRIQNRDDAESFELYYLQNYSIWMDIDILIKTIINGPKPIHILADFELKNK